MPPLQPIQPKPISTTTGTPPTTMTYPPLHPFTTTASTTSLANTTSSATTTVNNRRPSNTPTGTVTHNYPQPASNVQAPSSSSMLTKWPELPEVVMICDLPEYIPDDGFGRNAKRNEMYARTRLVALREHQQILVGFLSDLLALEQHQRMEEQMFVAAMDPIGLSNNTVAKAAAMAFSTPPTTAARSRTDSRLDSTAALVVIESECICDCEKRHRRRLEERNAAIRTYQRAILDLWQTDQNMCYWLSRYIRTTRHIGRGLDYMLAAISENHNSSRGVKHSASLSSLKCSPNLHMSREICDTSFGREAPCSDRSSSGVSNPELERMGILQSKLMDYSKVGMFNVKDSGGDCALPSQPLMYGVAAPSRIHPESSTLGNIGSQYSVVSQHISMQELSKALPSPHLSRSTEQHGIPIIRINSPELLLKSWHKVPEGANTAPAVTSAFPNLDFSSNSMSTTVPGRIFPALSGPLCTESIRELVTSSAPITPPPAVPAPKRPRLPPYPTLPPSPPPPRARSTVDIASTAFFPSVPSPSDSTPLSNLLIRPTPAIASAAALSAALTATKDPELVDAKSSSSLSPSPLLPPILELNPVYNCQDVHPFDSVPVLSTSAKCTGFSVVNNLETAGHSTAQPDATLPKLAAAITNTAASTKKTTSAAETPNNATPPQKPREYLEGDDINEIEASVFIGHHLQSLAKANELLLQFNKESRRSFGVLQRFEGARKVFERRVLGLRADGDADDSEAEEDAAGC
ncbi:hypothetical protein BGW39_000671 [Mortierella sp. 14UC]|nr:hypothetical protein BGW39_000671 [Mortierella sp. 14UC]